MRTPYCFVILLLAASNADAASLYKCAGPKKDAVSIQSAPCSAGSKQIWVRDGTPDSLPSEQQIAAKNAKREQDAAAARSLSRMAGTTQSSDVVGDQNSTTTDYRKQRCETVKQQVLQIRERNWRTLTVDGLRRLNAWIETECRNT